MYGMYHAMFVLSSGMVARLESDGQTAIGYQRVTRDVG